MPIRAGAPVPRLRPLRPEEAAALRQLFRDTVHAACAGDYTPAQLEAWAPEAYDPAACRETLSRRTTLVAEEAGIPLGFGAIGPDGYLDLLYVRRDRLRRGVGTALCAGLEALYPVDRITVHASRTARPFFEGRGYRVIRPQKVERRGQILENFVMEKELRAWT